MALIPTVSCFDYLHCVIMHIYIIMLELFALTFLIFLSDGTVDNEVRLEDFSDLQELGVVEVVGDDR
jgi:hypothetical protein